MAEANAEFEDFVARREIIREAQIEWTKKQELMPLGQYKGCTVFEEKKKQEKERKRDHKDYAGAKHEKEIFYGEAVLEIAKKVRKEYDEYAAIKHKCERDPAFHRFFHSQYKHHKERLSKAWTTRPSARGAALVHGKSGMGESMSKMDNMTQDELAELCKNGFMLSARISDKEGQMILPSKLPLTEEESKYTAEPWWWKVIPSQDGKEVPWVPDLL